MLAAKQDNGHNRAAISSLEICEAPFAEREVSGGPLEEAPSKGLEGQRLF